MKTLAPGKAAPSGRHPGFIVRNVLPLPSASERLGGGRGWASLERASWHHAAQPGDQGLSRHRLGGPPLSPLRPADPFGAALDCLLWQPRPALDTTTQTPHLLSRITDAGQRRTNETRTITASSPCAGLDISIKLVPPANSIENRGVTVTEVTMYCAT